MKVTIILPDRDVSPLVQAHLEDSSTSVAEHILKAVKLYNRTRELQADGKTMVVATSLESARRMTTITVLDEKGFLFEKAKINDD